MDQTAVSRSEQASPLGSIRRKDSQGRLWMDAMAGRASAIGFANQAVTDALQQIAHEYLGDASALVEPVADSNPSELAATLRMLVETAVDSSAESGSDSEPRLTDVVLLFADADLAIESMVANARKRTSGERFRTIALSQSDHGRTALCRSVSGLPQLQDGFGPMMAGFDHVRPNDLKSFKAAINDSTCSVLLSPISLNDAARPVDSDYLVGVRQLCDEHDLMLLIDESRLCFGASGHCFSLQSISSVRADAVVVSAGLFAGMPGGLMLSTERFMGAAMTATNRYPVQQRIATTMLKELMRRGLPQSAIQSTEQFTVALAERIAGFEFVRDVNATGMTIGIETDFSSAEFVQAAERNGLRIEAAGETAVLLQPPLQITEEDQQALLELLAETMGLLEQSSAELSA